MGGRRGGPGEALPNDTTSDGAFPGGGERGQQDLGGGLSLSAGSAIVIQDSAGNTLYTAAAAKAASSVVFGCETLVAGETYTLYVDGTEIAAATAVNAGQMQAA